MFLQSLSLFSYFILSDQYASSIFHIEQKVTAEKDCIVELKKRTAFESHAERVKLCYNGAVNLALKCSQKNDTVYDAVCSPI